MTDCESTYFGFLLEFGDHDDDGGLLNPDHPPEINNRVRHGALGSNVGLLFPLIPLHIENNMSIRELGFNNLFIL